MRRRRWQRAGLVAAAAAVVAVGVPALWPGGSSGPAWFASHDSASGSAASSARSESDSAGGSALGVAPRTQSQPSGDRRATGEVGAVTLVASGTAYTSAGLGGQAGTLAAKAAEPQNAQDLARQAPLPAGAATSPEQLRACLTALGVEAWMPVTADLAALDGRPAVVAVVSSDTGQSAYAVEPGCDATHPLRLAGPIPLH